MGNAAVTCDSAFDDKFVPLPIPEDASWKEEMDIRRINTDRHWEMLTKSRAKTDQLFQQTEQLIQRNEQNAREAIERMEQSAREFTQWMEQSAREAREQFQKPFWNSNKQAAQHVVNTTTESATMHKNDANLTATHVDSQHGEVDAINTKQESSLKSQEAAREDVVTKIELPIRGDQFKSKNLPLDQPVAEEESSLPIVESQPYIEAVHGEDGPQECFSDNEIVSEQIADFSTDQAKYVATDQMHGGQDMAHDHPFDQKKQVHDHFNCDSATRHTMLCGQQVVVYNGQSVANPEDTMFYDMVVGDKADLGTPSSLELQMKIMPRQPTKILGGQDYPSHEPKNSFKFFNEKYLCSFPTSSHKKSFHAINFDTSELGVKHRWPPPWPSGGREESPYEENTERRQD